jgi:hypothetical protein
VQVYQPAMSQPPAPMLQALPHAQPDGSGSYSNAYPTYSTAPYLDLNSTNITPYEPTTSSAIPNQNFSFEPQTSYDSSYHHPAAGDLAWNREVSPDNLADAMGELSIDHTGVGQSEAYLP